MSDVLAAPKTDAPFRKPDSVSSTLKQAPEAVAAGMQTMAAAAEVHTTAAAAGMQTMKETAGRGFQRASELARGYAEVQRTALETVTEAGKIYGEGLQGLAKQAADLSREQLEDGVAHLRSLAGVRSVTDLMQLQAKFARATMSRTLTASTALVEDYLNVAGRALAPVTARAREAALKVKQAA